MAIARSRFSGVDAVAKTRAPANRASAIAAPPTPEPAAVTSTDSPAASRARENSM